MEKDSEKIIKTRRPLQTVFRHPTSIYCTEAQCPAIYQKWTAITAQPLRGMLFNIPNDPILIGGFEPTWLFFSSRGRETKFRKLFSKTAGMSKCPTCGKTVYFAEEIKAIGQSCMTSESINLFTLSSSSLLEVCSMQQSFRPRKS